MAKSHMSALPLQHMLPSSLTHLAEGIILKRDGKYSPSLSFANEMQQHLHSSPPATQELQEQRCAQRCSSSSSWSSLQCFFSGMPCPNRGAASRLQQYMALPLLWVHRASTHLAGVKIKHFAPTHLWCIISSNTSEAGNHSLLLASRETGAASTSDFPKSEAAPQPRGHRCCSRRAALQGGAPLGR